MADWQVAVVARIVSIKLTTPEDRRKSEIGNRFRIPIPIANNASVASWGSWGNLPAKPAYWVC